MLCKLYEIEEDEAKTLIEVNEPEPSTSEPNGTNEGADQEAQGEDEEG